MTRKLFILITGFYLLLPACKNKDKQTGIADPSSVWFDYTISGREGDDNLTVKLQYRDGGKQGDGISISPPGKVMLDGTTLLPDSTRMNGVFYETHLPLESFRGKHTIEFISPDKKEYKETFDFQPISLLTILADSLHRTDLIFEFKGLEPEEMIQVLVTDTSFINNGISRMDTVRNGRLVIAKAELESLSNGPVLAEFTREYEKPVTNGTKKGGRVKIVYSLKREFLLRD